MSLGLTGDQLPTSAGIGMRFQHHQAIVRELPAVGWLEVHPENYMGGGPHFRALETARREYPVSLHGVGLSLGSAEGIDPEHLRRWADLVRRIDPILVSEHLSWSISGGIYLNDLIPLPYTKEALAVFRRNLERMQEALKRQVLIENPSAYVAFRHSEMAEWEFLGELVRMTGCGILLDVNNLHVSSTNLGFDPHQYLTALPDGIVGEIHLAGHTKRRLDDGSIVLIDDHGDAVDDPVWDLYAAALTRLGPVPTMIEWDSRIPPLDILVAEARKANAVAQATKANAVAFRSREGTHARVA